MRVMIGTNVIVSAVYNPNSKPAGVLRHVCENYELVLCDYIMSDPKDSPILNASVLADVDIIISGDKHFLALDLKRPQVLSPSDYYVLEGLI